MAPELIRTQSEPLHSSSHAVRKDKSLVRKYSSSRRLSLILLPTEQCNFRCVYCYEDFDIGRMRPEVVEGVKNLLLARGPELKFLGLSWFGGEPLMAYDIVLDIMHLANRVAANGNFVLSSNMTTNMSLLTRERLDALTALRVSHYQVSFDGDKPYHDTMRLRADKRGTFDQLWGRLEDAHLSNATFTMDIRVHVTTQNAQSVESLIERLAKLLRADGRFRLWIRPLSRFGGANDALLPILSDAEKPWLNPGDVVNELRAKAKGKRLILNDLVSEVCYATKLNTFLVRSDGRLAKCTVALNNTVGRLLPDGTMEIDPNKAKWWSRGLVSRDRNQLACPLYGSL